MKKLIALAVLVAAGVAAYASDWQVIGRSRTGTLTYERTMLKRQGSHVLAWVQESFTEPQTTPGTGDQYDMMLFRVDMDCARDTAAVLSSRSTLKGKPAGAYDAPLPAANIEPDSVLALVETAVCHSG